LNDCGLYRYEMHTGFAFLLIYGMIAEFKATFELSIYLNNFLHFAWVVEVISDRLRNAQDL
jgi:hypothetical protein